MKHIHGKIGNMRKSVSWFVYPRNKETDTVVIQNDNRIAQVWLKDKKVMLSDGKGGFTGFHKLTPILGAKMYDCPQEILDQLAEQDTQTTEESSSQVSISSFYK